MSIASLHDWEDQYENSINDLGLLPNMKYLLLDESCFNQASFVMKSVNFENVKGLYLNSFHSPNIDIEDLNIRKLSVLRLCDVDEQWSARLLKDNSSTLTTLNIGFSRIDEHDFKDIKFSKLKQLKIRGMYETDALTLIEKSKNSIEEIYLTLRTYGNKKLESVKNLKLPRLKKVHLDDQDFISSNLVSSLISACNDNTIILIQEEKINKSLLEKLL